MGAGFRVPGPRPSVLLLWVHGDLGVQGKNMQRRRFVHHGVEKQKRK